MCAGLGLQGAIPRAIWIAPLGAMNFAGYELAKRAMGVQSSGVEVSDKTSSAAAGAAAVPTAPEPAVAAEQSHAAQRPTPVAPAAAPQDGAAPAHAPAPASAAASGVAEPPKQADGGACVGSAATPPESAAAPAHNDVHGNDTGTSEGGASQPPAVPPPGGEQPLARIVWPWQQQGPPRGAQRSVRATGLVDEAGCLGSVDGSLPSARKGYCAACGRAGDGFEMPDKAVGDGGSAGRGGAPAMGAASGLTQVRSSILAWPGRW